MSGVLFPQVTPTEWMKQWPGTRVSFTKCFECGGKVVINRPWISADYVGFDATHCPECGSEHKACQAISRKPEEWGVYE
jgi:ferredoxin-like protein FixX